jgi:adenosylhomocysteinase
MHGLTGLPEYTVRDVGLAEQGSRKVEMAEAVMPVLGLLRKRYESERPFDGLRVAACLHVTKETAVLVHVLRAGGARVALCASNPLSTQDDVAASLAKAGFNIYAFRGMTEEDYYRAIGNVLAHRPHLTVDDGADLVTSLHKAALSIVDRSVEITGLGRWLPKDF